MTPRFCEHEPYRDDQPTVRVLRCRKCDAVSFAASAAGNIDFRLPMFMVEEPDEVTPQYREGALAQRFLPNGDEIALYLLLFGTIRLGIGKIGDEGFRDVW